jgi:hypothetical protein
MRIGIAEAAIEQHSKPAISGKLIIETNKVFRAHLIYYDLHN